MGSTEIEFHPKGISGGKYFADTKTAGATSLLMQIALPVCIFANREICLDLKGGTNAEMAPQVDYMTEIFRPHLEKFGASFDFDLYKRGYFPKGGGHVIVTIKPVASLNSVTLTDFGKIKRFFGWSFVAGSLPLKLADEMSEAAVQVLKQAGNSIPIEIEAYKEDGKIARDNCSGIVLGCETNSGCLLGGSRPGN
jgi:RNA 3'-terminal phosphate cyclase (ATP)